MSLPSSLVADINAKSKAKASAAADTARDAARIAGVIADIHVMMDRGGDAAEAAVRAARASDLIVVDQPGAVMDMKAAIFEEALFRSGRPVLVATPKRAPVRDVSKAMLAWDGTSHATRLLHHARGSWLHPTSAHRPETCWRCAEKAMSTRHCPESGDHLARP